MIGYTALAMAVICQWKQDKKPRAGEDGIELWKMYLDAHCAIMEGREKEYSLNGIKRRQK